MEYRFTYLSSMNDIQTIDNHLYIYDFGDKKAFLYENEFLLFKILNKSCKENVYTETCIKIDGFIPKNALSIEKYNCMYDKINNIYKTPSFTIRQSVSSYEKPMPKMPELQQQEQKQQQQQEQQKKVPQLQQQQKKSCNKKRGIQNQNEVSEKKQQVELLSHYPSKYPILFQSNSWISLDQVMKSPFSSPHQGHPLQPLLEVQYTPSYSKKHSSSPVRQFSKKVQQQIQDPIKEYSSQDQSQVIA